MFPNAIEEMNSRFDGAFREMSLEYTREQTGEVDAPTGWVGLIMISSVDIEITAKSLGEDLREVPPGAYIVRINSDGLVWAFRYSSIERAINDFNNIAATYSEWLDSPVFGGPHDGKDN